MPQDALAPTRRDILTALKRGGPSTSAELATQLDISSEAVRQHLKRLEAEGLITVEREEVGALGGRPAHRYSLTSAGEHVFPKRYDDLVVVLLDTVGARLGDEALSAVLAAVVDAKVAAWAPRLEGLTTDEARLEVLASLYVEDDPWVEVERDDEGWTLVERNCPYLEVARRRPGLCRVTEQTLSRLLGREVKRTRTFQAGHGLCAFRIPDEGDT